jgi:hypothetical protein
MEFDYFNRFLEGFRATVFSPNAMRCSQKIQANALDFNTTFLNFKAAPKTTQPDKYVFNFTKVVSNSTAEAVGECYTTLFNVYQYSMMRKA